MRRFAAALLGAVLLAGACSDGGGDVDPPAESASPASASSPSPTPDATTGPAGPTIYDAAGCPIPDEAFCETATDVVAALQAAEPERLFALAREDRLPCAKVNTEYFPQCDGDEVLEGYGLSGPDFVVDVVDAGEYRDRLADAFLNVDPAYADDRGSGAPQVIGVGTCGPDIPGRRTYHVAWTAAIGEGGASERVLGSFELTFDDGEWRTALWYLGTLEEWEAAQGDAVDLAFCEAAFTPWPPA